MRRDDRGVVLGLYRSGPDRDLIEHALSLGVRGIDTAYNYRAFTSHRTLARVASDLLGEFTVSTKVGYFPTDGAGGRALHSLEPARLRAAIERTADDLGRCPDVVFLHNPEHSLRDKPADQARDQLSSACRALADAVAAGLCGAWGIATWDPRPVLDAVPPTAADLAPAALLARAGLSVAATVLHAAEELWQVLGVSSEGRWGMSPFGANLADPAWQAVNLAPFLLPDQRASTAQAAFRLAYEVPAVTRVAVGTTSGQHLRDLVAAVDLAADEAAVRRYRELVSSTAR